MKKIGKIILFVLIVVITISIIIIFKNLNKIEQQQAKIVATNENEIENVVVEEFQKGYYYKEEVLRHGMVKVAN